jgi:hypothetical protein
MVKKERYGQVASVDGHGPLGTAKVSIEDEDKLMGELASKEREDGKGKMIQGPGIDDPQDIEHQRGSTPMRWGRSSSTIA